MSINAEMVHFYSNIIMKTPNEPVCIADRGTTDAVNKILKGKQYDTRVISVSEKENYILISGYAVTALKEYLEFKLTKYEAEAEQLKRNADRLKGVLKAL